MTLRVALVFRLVNLVDVGGSHHVARDAIRHEGARHALHVEAELQGVLELLPSFTPAEGAAIVRVGHVGEAPHRLGGR